MADDNKLTQADIDKAVKAAVDKVTADFESRIEALDDKNKELLDEAKKAKAELRKVKEVSPEDVAAIEAERDKALTDLAESQKSVKTLTTERDKAVKALETEQGAARNYALEAEISSAIAAGQVAPQYVPAFKAMVMQQAKAELVDGKYSVTIGDKPAKDYVTEFLATDDGKAFKLAAANSGGGASGGGGKGGGRSMSQAEVDSMRPKDRATFFAEGGTISEAA